MLYSIRIKYQFYCNQIAYTYLYFRFQSECLKHVIYSIQTSNKSGDVLTDPLFALGRDAVNIVSGPNPPSQSTSACKSHNNKDANSSGAGSIQSALNKESDAVTQHVAHKIKVLQVCIEYTNLLVILPFFFYQQHIS